MTKTLLQVLSGQPVWPPPVWLMRQAGRYLPEYWETRAKAGDFLALATTPALAAEVTLQPIRRFGMDAAILFSDILILPWALGQGLEYRAGEGPVLPPIRDAASLATLDRRCVEAAVAPVMETVRLVRKQLDGATLIGFAGSPFTVACYMVEGGGSREFAHVRRLAYADPALFDALIALLVETTIEYLSGQAQAGAEALMLFDSWAGILPPSQFRRHVIAATKRVVEVLKRRHPGIPVIGFPRLAGTMLGEYARETGADAVALDTAVDPAVADREVPAGTALQGNLDPLLLLAGGPVLAQETARIATALRNRPHIFNLGHGILPDTPPEHVAALIATLRGLPA